MRFTTRARRLIILTVGLLLIMACNTLTGGNGSIEPSATSLVIPTVTTQFEETPTITEDGTGLIASSTSENSAPGEETPIPTATLAPSTELLYSDDFNDNSSGWDRVENRYGITDYYQGGFRIKVTSATYIKWANPGEQFADVRVEVDAELIGGSKDNTFGVLCRYQDESNFYALVISSDGYYAIRKRAEGNTKVEIISGDSFQKSSLIDVNQNGHHLTAECVGDTLSLYVDGKLLSQVVDAEYAEGDVGLIASTGSEAMTDILFDNFEVYIAP